jgi:hypothetical protein
MRQTHINGFIGGLAVGYGITASVSALGHPATSVWGIFVFIVVVWAAAYSVMNTRRLLRKLREDDP